MMRALLTGLFLLALNAYAAEPADIEIEAAWIREAPPVAGVQAGYFTLCNRHDESSATLERVASDAFGRIEMHETIETGDSSRMVELEAVTVPAGKCIIFERGGRHLMLFEPAARLVNGDTVTLQLIIDGNAIEHEFPVRRGNTDAQGDDVHDHHQHHGH